MDTKPTGNPAPTSFADKVDPLARATALLLNQQRDALLHFARSRREWLSAYRACDRETDPVDELAAKLCAKQAEASSTQNEQEYLARLAEIEVLRAELDAKKAEMDAAQGGRAKFYAKKAKVAQGELAKFYAREIAERIEVLVPLLDEIPDPQRCLEAMEALYWLIARVSGEGETCMVSPIQNMVTKLGMEHARSKNLQRAKQEQRRELLLPVVAEEARKDPSASPATIATRLRKRKGFAAQFKVTRRTVEADVAFLLASETE